MLHMMFYGCIHFISFVPFFHPFIQLHSFSFYPRALWLALYCHKNTLIRYVWHAAQRSLLIFNGFAVTKISHILFLLCNAGKCTHSGHGKQRMLERFVVRWVFFSSGALTEKSTLLTVTEHNQTIFGTFNHSDRLNFEKVLRKYLSEKLIPHAE